MSADAQADLPSEMVNQQPARAVRAVAESVVVLEGAGVPVRRALPSPVVTYELVDPFLLLDEGELPPADPNAPAFPPHPHRGFEIVTYVLAGSLAHEDNAGNRAVARAGGLQRITAGRGIWHGEGPGESREAIHILQLWINLAQTEKRVEPSYQIVEPAAIPIEQIGDATVRVLVGDGSPVVLRTPAIYRDVTLPANGLATLAVPSAFQGFVYVLAGDGRFGTNERLITAKQVAALGPGGPLPVRAGARGVRFVLGAGQPHREPVRWRGPFVD